MSPPPGGSPLTSLHMLQVNANWSPERESDGELFDVRCNLLSPADSSQEGEVLTQGREFFLDLLRDFVAHDGVIHVHTNAAFGVIHGWPRTLRDAAEVADAVAQLVNAHPEREFYPVVIWFETSRVANRHVITTSDRDAAAKDMDLLHELLRAGMARLFLDEQFADLLAGPECRFMIRAYVKRAAARSHDIVTDFRL